MFLESTSSSGITLFRRLTLIQPRLLQRDLPSHSDLERLGVHGGLHRGLYIEAILARNDDFLDLDDWERTVAQREELERASGGGG